VKSYSFSTSGSEAPPPQPPTQPPPSGGGTASSNRNLMIVLAYVWLLCLIPLITEKDDREVQWHAKHGLVLFIAEIAFWVVLTVLSSVGVGCVLALLSPIFGLIFLAVHIICIVKGINGQRFIIPGISQFADKF
jgi:uncharacterized membrane protein